MSEELTKLAEDALTAAYEKGLGDKSEDREAWTLRAAVAALAKAEFLEAVKNLEIDAKELRARLKATDDLLDRYMEDNGHYG